MICTDPTCSDPAKVKGLCRKHYNRMSAKRYVEANPEKRAATMKMFAEKNPDYHYTRKLSYKYGISVEDYERMWAEQEGRCAACPRLMLPKGSKPRTHAAVVDHCHKTGRVRGLLCGGCNSALGALEESRASILGLLDYLDTKCTR